MRHTVRRTMSEYHKIHTVYNRDPATRHKSLIVGEWSRPEFGYLATLPWVWTEKVDGTTIRVIWDRTNEDGSFSVRFGGKTNNAAVPTPLLAHLMDTFTVGRLGAALTGPITLYGEGYGPKIQNGGRYRDTPGFILFDALAGDVWLERGKLEVIADALGIPIVPIVGVGTLYGAIALVRDGGFKSEVAADASLAPEGLVMRPLVELKDRLGHRIITKIKRADFTVAVSMADVGA